MNLNNLTKALKDQPPFRLKQAKEAIFKQLIENWSQALNLPSGLREKLNNEYPLAIKAQISESKDKKSVKALIYLRDGLKIESVLLRHEDRNTVCLSSQVGCALGCLFCATGQLGFRRNLDEGEIIEQVLVFNRYLKTLGEKVHNLVFMGMGEPFLNYGNVIGAIKKINSKETFNIGWRHISISTIGIPEGIRKLVKENLQVNLAVSLHAPNDDLRSQIIPLNAKYPLKEILKAVKYYLAETNRRVMFEYILIKGFNDQDSQARQLADLLADLPKKLYLINLILYNQSDFPKKKFLPSDKKQIEIFKRVLGRNKINVTERLRLGRGIQAACGQLTSQNK
ncbi:MAG TPA: 23S rRNA (adenine(2503)-C(2))-methyltransferase RlmN [Candidatus Uhrbacteria bacterium]|nr:23S rRNA (adenine(2503)-C(2))-methyltransferase RlmN [Candidatus Uhrbacteria bacterium]